MLFNDLTRFDYCNQQEQLQLFQNTPVQDDYSDILLEVAESLDSYSGQYLKENIKKNVSEIEILAIK